MTEPDVRRALRGLKAFARELGLRVTLTERPHEVVIQLHRGLRQVLGVCTLESGHTGIVEADGSARRPLTVTDGGLRAARRQAADVALRELARLAADRWHWRLS